MITGQETISELLKKYPKSKSALHQFGLTKEAEKHFHYRNLAHAALVQKIPLQKILEEISAITGEPIKIPKVKGLPPNAGSIGESHPARLKPGLNRIGKPSGIKKIIAIHSGKGGVGKTFVAINLAAHLTQKGFKVGLLDADIDCPNIMKVLKVEGKLIANAEKKITPLEKFGMKVVSMAPLLESENEVLLWRGPIVSRVVEQFIYDTAWGNLDYLIIDVPPGTSDVPLTLFHILKEAELIIVATPQTLALLDAKKSATMAKKMKIRILGIVENMSGEIFGEGHGAEIAKELKVQFLGSIGLEKKYAKHHEEGEPPVLRDQKLQDFFGKIEKITKL